MLQAASLQSVLQDGPLLLHGFRTADTKPTGATAAHAACAISSSVNATIIKIIRYKRNHEKYNPKNEKLQLIILKITNKLVIL